MNDAWVWIAPVGIVLGWLALTRMGKISRARAHELVASGARLVDVRSEREFTAGHVAGATNVPLDRLSGRAQGLASERTPVVVYCASGMRSAAAKRTLRAAGVEAYDLGAMSRW